MLIPFSNVYFCSHLTLSLGGTTTSSKFTRINSICRQLIATNNQTFRDLKFDVIEIQGGGRIEIQSDKEGLSVTCRRLWIRSGAVLIADRLSISCQSVTIEQSGVIDLNYKVSCFYDLPCSHLEEKRKDIKSRRLKCTLSVSLIDICPRSLSG